MKKMFILILSALLLIFFSSDKNYAQFQLKLAPVTGMNFNIHTGSDLKNTGTGFGFVIGASADISFTKNLGIITNIQFYDNRSGSHDQAGQYLGYNATLTTSASIAYFQIEPLFKLNLPETNLYFIAGPSVGFNVESSYEVTFNLPQIQYNSKETGSFNDMLVRLELKLGAGYDFDISKNIDLSPQISFGYGLTKVESDVSWRILTFQALIGVKFKLI